jgi:uncharacterized membrane protein required for colicin V production
VNALRALRRHAPSMRPRVALAGAVSSGTAAPRPPVASDPSALVLLLSMSGGVIGYMRGAGREFWSLLGTGLTFFMLEFQWPLVVRWTNWLWQHLFSDPLIPPYAETHVWQMAFFVIGVLVAYLFSQLVAQPPPGGALELLNLGNLISRVVGAFFGAATGFLIGVFTLSRLVAGPDGAIGPNTVARQVLGHLTVPVLFVGFLIIVVFGVLSLGGRGKKVYGA